MKHETLKAFRGSLREHLSSGIFWMSVSFSLSTSFSLFAILAAQTEVFASRLLAIACLLFCSFSGFLLGMAVQKKRGVRYLIDLVVEQEKALQHYRNTLALMKEIRKISLEDEKNTNRDQPANAEKTTKKP